MLTTPKYGLRYPELTDTADANLDFKNLATDVEGAGPMAWATPPDLHVPGNIYAGNNITFGASIDNTAYLYRRAQNVVGVIGGYAADGASGAWGFWAYDGQTYPRAFLRNDGQLLFGSGGTGLDTALYRQSAGVLKTNGQIDASGGFFVNGTPVTGGGGGGNYQGMQDEGVTLTARPTMNFVGAGVTATDDAANSRTVVTIPGGGGGGGNTTWGATPPASPTLCDRWVTNFGTLSYQMEFVYRPDLDSTYPWMFVGGPPLVSDPGGALGGAGGTVYGPDLIIPRSGIWMHDVGCYYINCFASTYAQIGVHSSSVGDIFVGRDAGYGDRHTQLQGSKALTVGAGSNSNLIFDANGSNTLFSPYLRAWPVRIA